ncbi:Saccharopine dehydrogenase-domain-containing protein [Dendryphion nanum]|uniref:Saccharopine dehydrogenase-domain-containing protein n=1 Tax=Dendryphion nanum TaxID=256645 RepID=A0A9P9DUV0_9PLEO|nr:Saccharopine dehydrogenase-domain-containing protein [Dendryphion nanum]
MVSGSREYELVLIGATGYTGKLAAEWVHTRLPADLKWAIVGRNTKKLQAVVEDLSKLDANRKKPDVLTVNLTKDELDPLARKTRLILTTVGPYMFHGEPVLAACAENGTHYLDCTGEIPWYYDMVARYDEVAKRNGAIIIPQCGLDSVPADISSYVLAKHIRKTLQAPTSSVTMTLYAFKTGVSGGTSATALNLFSKYSLKHLGESMKPYSISPVKPTAPSKPLKGESFLHRIFQLPYISELGGIQTTGTMAAVDTCIVHRSWGLFETIAKTSSQSDLSYGSKFRFTEYMRSKSLIGAASWKFGFNLIGLLLAIPITRWILSPFIRRFVVPAQGEGPSEEERKNDFMSYRSIGIADTPKQEKVMAKLEFAYGAYVVTGLTLAAAADVILRGDLKGTEAGSLGGGILTPATLGDQYVEKLREFGIKIRVGSE